MPAAKTCATGICEQEARLPNGSTGRVNTRREITVKCTVARQVFELYQRGSLFDVAEAPDQPLVLGVDGGAIKALGTAAAASAENHKAVKLTSRRATCGQMPQRKSR